MTNKEISAVLYQLSKVYETAPDGAEISQPTLTMFVYSKAEAIATIKAIGGKFTKHVGITPDYMEFRSARIPGVTISINRDSVCRKIVTYDCEPLLSPAEEADIMAVSE